MDVTIEQRPELRVGAVRHIGPYNQIPNAFAKLGEIVNSALREKPGDMLAIYYDDPETTPANELKSDAALVFDDAAKLPAGLNEHRIPGGRYARTTHIGPYERLGDAWARFMGEWLPSSGNRLADVPFARADVACVEAKHVRVRRSAVHRLLCAAVCAPVFSIVVRFP